MAAKFKMDPIEVANTDYFGFAFRQAAFELILDAEKKEAERSKGK